MDVAVEKDDLEDALDPPPDPSVTPAPDHEREFVVQGLPKYVNARDIEKLLAPELPEHTIVKVNARHGGAVSVRMQSTEDRDSALAALSLKNVVFRQRALSFVKAWSNSERQQQKRKANDARPEEAKRPKTVAEATTALYAMPYDAQLELKAKSVREVLGKLAKRLLQEGFGGEWLTKEEMRSMGGRCCPQAAMVSAPVTEGYRNKCDFTIGMDEAGRPCVGFMLGQYREGANTVGEPSSCVHVSAEMKRVARAVEEVVVRSGLPVYANNEGFWRQVLVRQNRRGELLISLQVNPTGREPADVRLAVEEAVRAASDVALIKSAFMLAVSGVSHSNDLPHSHLSGERELVEELLGVRFRISPNSFFQVNTSAAHRLGEVIETIVASVGGAVTLLDVCCGAGAWGLCLASKVSRVIGIEMCADAVQDARRNAEDNGITNADFRCGKAEDVLDKVLQHLGSGACVAIVDPPRAGLHKNVLKALRGCAQLEHIVYISCNPSSWVEDAATLNRPPSKAYRGEPFRPVSAVPVDLFPHTPHCELVVHMVRLPANVQTPAHYPAVVGAPAGGRAVGAPAAASDTVACGVEEEAPAGGRAVGAPAAASDTVACGVEDERI